MQLDLAHGERELLYRVLSHARSMALKTAPMSKPGSPTYDRHINTADDCAKLMKKLRQLRPPPPSETDEEYDQAKADYFNR